MFTERHCQNDCVGLECISQRLGLDCRSDRPSLGFQLLGRATARNGHVDVLTGKGAGESLAYLTESYNRVTHATSPIHVEIDSPARPRGSCIRCVVTSRRPAAVNAFAPPEVRPLT